MSEVIYDPILGKLREGDPGGGGGGSGTVTGIEASVNGGTATVLATGGVGSVKFVGVSGTTISSNGSGEIEIAGGGGGGGGTPATVSNIMTGSGSSNIVNVSNLRGALTAGQAVDVTSKPDGITGTDWKDTIVFSGTTLGFALFPKFASGLKYLMIADIILATDLGDDPSTVSPSGTWIDGTTTPIELSRNESKRVAMLFTTAAAAFTFAFDNASAQITNLREYEVTSCSADAIAYIAGLADPDAFADYYLVKADMVQPWTYIIDMGSSPAVTIASGLSYKLNATGTHQLTVDTCPAGYDGRDAIIRITLGGHGVIRAIHPLQLGGALVPYAVNNCVVRYRDGEAVLLVDDTLAGYVVTVNTGTGEGSLPYGLATTNVPYIAFSPSTDGTPIDISGATTAAEEVTVIGNGYTETVVSGGINCTSKTTFANLGMDGVVVSSGTLTMGDVYIPNGATVAVNGGGLAVEKVTGNGGTINLGGKNVVVASNGSAYASGVIISSGNATSGGAFLLNGGASIYLHNVELVSNSVTGFGGAIVGLNSNTIVLDSCYVHDNTNRTGVLYQTGATTVMYIQGSTIGTDQRVYVAGGKCVFAGSNFFTAILNGGGSCIISSGAIVDMTGNANASPIAPTGGVVVSGGCTVINSAGATVSIAGGTYTKINKDGTTA